MLVVFDLIVQREAVLNVALGTINLADPMRHHARRTCGFGEGVAWRASPNTNSRSSQSNPARRIPRYISRQCQKRQTSWPWLMLNMISGRLSITDHDRAMCMLAWSASTSATHDTAWGQACHRAPAGRQRHSDWHSALGSSPARGAVSASPRRTVESVEYAPTTRAERLNKADALYSKFRTDERYVKALHALILLSRPPSVWEFAIALPDRPGRA